MRKITCKKSGNEGKKITSVQVGGEPDSARNKQTHINRQGESIKYTNIYTYIIGYANIYQIKILKKKEL